MILEAAAKFGATDHESAARPRPVRGPGSRADLDHPTRHRLLDAALDLVDDHDLDDVSISAITGGAGVAKGTFYVHFADRDALLIVLHQRFHDELFTRIAATTDPLPPGAERLFARLAAFLDGCLAQRGVRALLWSAGRQPALRTEVARRNAQAASTIAADLDAMNVGNQAHDLARLLVAATTETSLAELDAGRRLPRLRAALQTLASLPR